MVEHRAEQRHCLRRARLPRLFWLLLLEFVCRGGKQNSYLKSFFLILKQEFGTSRCFYAKRQPEVN